MRKDEIRSIGDAFAYYTDCQLATVADMAMKKSRPKGEYQRQINIAQGMVDCFREYGVEDRNNRVHDIIKKSLTVVDWAKRFEPGTEGSVSSREGEP